jgi:hypothetical protein
MDIQHEDYIDNQINKVKKAHDPVWGYSLQVRAGNSYVKTNWLNINQEQLDKIQEIIIQPTLKQYHGRNNQ